MISLSSRFFPHSGPWLVGKSVKFTIVSLFVGAALVRISVLAGSWWASLAVPWFETFGIVPVSEGCKATPAVPEFVGSGTAGLGGDADSVVGGLGASSALLLGWSLWLGASSCDLRILSFASSQDSKLACRGAGMDTGATWLSQSPSIWILEKVWDLE